MTGETWISLCLNTAALAKGRGPRRNQVYHMINQPLGGRLNICCFNIRGIFSMAFSTIVHLHPVPGILLESADTFSPDIPAVACNSILLIDL